MVWYNRGSVAFQFQAIILCNTIDGIVDKILVDATKIDISLGSQRSNK